MKSGKRTLSCSECLRVFSTYHPKGLFCSKQCFWKHRKEKPPPSHQKCPHCEKVLPFNLEFFGRHTKSKHGISYLCRTCNAKKARERGPDDRLKLRVQVLTAYGSGKLACVCCKETHIEFLTIDHIKGGGSAERRTTGTNTLYRRLRRQGFPQGDYRTLCFNCNWAYGVHGYCPHQAKSQKAE